MNADRWARELTFGGFDDWRLPSAMKDDGSGICLSDGCTGNEFGHLWHVALGNPVRGPLVNTGPFINMRGPFNTGNAYLTNTVVGGGVATFWTSEGLHQMDTVVSGTVLYMVAHAGADRPVRLTALAAGPDRLVGVSPNLHKSTPMSTPQLALAVAALLALPSAHAINARYAEQLEKSGCTQVSEAQGCDIKKSRAENAQAGFAVTPAPGKPGAKPAAAVTPYAGQWVAKSDAGATVATIRIDANEQVWVDGKQVKARRSDGGLVFKVGKITFRIQGDRRLQGEDVWNDVDAKTRGPIVAR